MKFYYYDHQTKGKPYHDALIRHGWSMTRNEAEANMVLVDSEITRHEQFERFGKRGVPIFIYPHAARPDLLPDFEGSVASPYVTAHFVAARGHVEIMEAYGYPNPMPVVGWHLCPIQRFKARANVRRALFAPIHSSRNGAMSKIDREINVETFKILYELVKMDVIDLTVRYLYNLQFTGLVERDRVIYVKGNPDHSTMQIDAAQVVVSHQTFAHLAVARGIPTVMMGESIIPRYTQSNGRYMTAKSWDKYSHLLMFPLDILNTDNPYELLQEAGRSDAKIADWRSRLIGSEQFDPDTFISHVMEYVKP